MILDYNYTTSDIRLLILYYNYTTNKQFSVFYKNKVYSKFLVYMDHNLLLDTKTSFTLNYTWTMLLDNQQLS